MRKDPKISAALYQAMKAYTREHRRIHAPGSDIVCARPLLVAIEAFNAEISDENAEVLDDEG